MHDIRFIRDNPDAFETGLARRGLAANVIFDEIGARRVSASKYRVGSKPAGKTETEHRRRSARPKKQRMKRASPSLCRRFDAKR